MNFVRALLFLFVSGLPIASNAQAFEVQDLSVMVDAHAVETIASASSPEAAGRYTKLAGALSEGYTRKVHWLRFTVRAPAAGEWWLEVQPPFLDDLRLFEPIANDGFLQHQAGDRFPFSAREEDYRGFVFKFKVPDTTPRTFYLRVQTSSTSLVALQIWRPDQFRAAKNTEYAILGFYYGFLALVLTLNLLLWILLRESLYGWFSLCLVANMLLFFGANGFAGQYLLSESPRIADLWVGLSVMFFIASSAPFYRRMLHIERDQFVYFWLFRFQVILPFLLVIPVLMGYFSEAANLAVISSAIATLVMLHAAFSLWHEGKHESPFLLVAICVTMVGGMSSWMMLLGFTPGGMFLVYFRQVTLLCTVIAMQCALALRFRGIRLEQQRAMARVHLAEMQTIREREMHVEQGRFIAMLSHELKTPLAVIDSAAQALERIDHLNNPEATRRHERIRRSVSRIDRLVEQFLSKDRLEAGGRLQLRRGQVDAAQMLRQIAEISDDGAERRLLLTAPAMLPMMADPALLQVAVANLVDNALKYAPLDSKVTVHARAHEEQHTPGIEILVADQGPGISPTLQAEVFSAYTRGENAAHVAGAGLGLYLVRRIVELHGGTIELLPQPVGALFRLWLPTDLEVTP